VWGETQREDEEASVFENDAEKGLFSIPVIALPRVHGRWEGGGEGGGRVGRRPAARAPPRAPFLQHGSVTLCPPHPLDPQWFPHPSPPTDAPAEGLPPPAVPWAGRGCSTPS